MITLEGVTKKFGGRTAVEDLTLRVPCGEIFGLLGHNGAGKSTAIGMMLGQVWPTAGEVRICGYDVAANRTLALEKVGAIFESPAFYDYLSGLRNLEILSSYTANTPRARILEVLDWVGLMGREKSAVRTYSHGMRARLALAQALLPGPELLILDEPSDGLDPEGIHEMRQMITRMHREMGVTILLSSHFLSEVEQVCTRIAVLNQGRKVFEGALAETLQAQKWIKLKTGDFAAASNLLKEEGLVKTGHHQELLALADGTGVDAVVRTLVRHGFPVYEIGPVEQTLEDFYLTLMRGAPDMEKGTARGVES
jgi:ABC-2 type transport system ATP-binding protein